MIDLAALMAALDTLISAFVAAHGDPCPTMTAADWYPLLDVPEGWS